MLRLSAWREPQQNFRERNLGIAELRLPRQDYQDLWNDGGDLLLSLSSRAHDDSDVVFSLAAFYLDSGDMPRALEFARRAVELSPQSAVMALSLARILEASGADAQAEQQYLKAIGLNPSWKEPYGRLVMLYVRQRKFEDAIRILDRYLTWNSNEILFHEWRKQLLSQEKDVIGSHGFKGPALPLAR
jgi:Flp pilus assembly protein TadD